MTGVPRAVVLLSGGVDSTTTVAVAQAFGCDVYALSFRYGQTLAVELERAVRVAAALKVKAHRIVTVDLAPLGGSRLLGDDTVDAGASAIPATYVPARNTIFLSIGLAWAEVLGARFLMFGANAVDYSGYPDCRPEFVEAFEEMANRATRFTTEGTQRLHVLAPLVDLSKADIIRLGLALGVDYGLTHSCYFPDPEGRACGTCASCAIRLKGFAEVGLADPVTYRTWRRTTADRPGPHLEGKAV
jgi:7-cyano-7-deazaguanine synthase